MKLLIFSHDESILSLVQDLENLEWASCASTKEAQEYVKEWRAQDADDLIVTLLDFEVGLKSLDEFSKKYQKDDALIRIGLAHGESLKDLRVHQKSKTAAHGYLVKPINVTSLESMINDHETALFVKNNNLLDEGAELGEIELTKLESKALKELGDLDEDKEDYDTTHPGMILPKDFANAVAESVTRTSEPTMTSEIDIVDHASQLAHFKNDPTHKKIQQIFDQVFSFGANELSASVDDHLLSDEDEDEFSAATPAPSEDVMSKKKEELDIGLEFDMSEDLSETTDDELLKTKEAEQSAQNEAEDLGFSFGEDEDTDSSLSVGESTGGHQVAASEEEDESANEFSFDADEPLQESDEVEAQFIESDSEGDDGGFDLSFDDNQDSESLDLGAKGEVSASPVEDDEEVGGLDLGDEDDGDLNFSLGGAENSGEALEASAEDEGFGDLGIDDDNDADPTVLGTSADLLKSAEISDGDEDTTAEIGENTLDKVDKTISEILLGEVGLSEEDSTGAFDLPDGLPSELTEDMMADEATDSQEFSLAGDLEEEEEEVAELGETTNPTVVTSTAGLVPPTRPEVENEEDHFAFDSLEDEADEEEIEEEIEELSEASFSFAEEDDTNEILGEKTKATEVVRTPRSLSSVSDDELMRLQATIRQLREEREEHLKEIQELKKEVKLVEQGGLSNKAELEESKIEISILKKRHKTEVEEYKYQLKLSDERKQIFEERCKNYQKEFDRLNQKVRIEFNQVKQREKELESQLELVTMDTDAQVQARDGKILELKRKIDALEFNMENATIREQKSRDDKMRLEERLHKIMTTLRGSIKVLEEDDLSSPPALNDHSGEGSQDNKEPK